MRFTRFTYDVRSGITYRLGSPSSAWSIMPESTRPDLLDLLRSGPANSGDETEVIWHLGPAPLLGTVAAREARRRLRRAVLAALATFGVPVFLRPSDEPPDPELERHLIRRPHGAWEVRNGRADSEAMHAELTEGDWCLYAAPEPLRGNFPDAFRSSRADLADFMRRAEVTCFVASFHDDTEWIIGLLRRTTQDQL